jgi:hypothetical protein
MTSILRTFTATALSLVAAAAAAVTACSGQRIDVPADAHVHLMQTDKIVLRSTSDASMDSPSCKTAALPAQIFVEMKDEVAGHFLLRPHATDAGPKLAVLHVTQLDTGRTWCVESTADGVTTAISGDFTQGTYAISVQEPHSMSAHGYEVVVEKL